MKTKLPLLVPALLLAAAPGNCFADYGIVDVSKAKTKTKEMAVTIRMEKNGDAGIRVRMEFRSSGKLKQFSPVEFRMSDGKSRGLSAALRDALSSSGHREHRIAPRFFAETRATCGRLRSRVAPPACPEKLRMAAG
jgi:hypothetical protein